MTGTSPPPAALEFLQNVAARIAFIREAYDPGERDVALEDLEWDVTSEIERLRELAAA